MCSKKVVAILFVFFKISFLTNPATLFSQDTNQKSVRKKASGPEKWWAVCHLFVARKALKITNESLHKTDSLKNAGILGNDLNGGQLDAFKHAFWMASLAQEIKWRKAYKLGKAHEKGNYLSYKKGVKQGKSNLPDKRSSDMDLRNNDIGIKIGNDNKDLSRENLLQLILDSILASEMQILNKDKEGNFLDCDNQIIPQDSLSGTWENDKCLVPSNSLNY